MQRVLRECEQVWESVEELIECERATISYAQSWEFKKNSLPFWKSNFANFEGCCKLLGCLAPYIAPVCYMSSNTCSSLIPHDLLVCWTRAEREFGYRWKRGCKIDFDIFYLFKYLFFYLSAHMHVKFLFYSLYSYFHPYTVFFCHTFILLTQ